MIELNPRNLNLRSVLITVGAAVRQEDVVVVLVYLALDLGDGVEPHHPTHVALGDGVVTAAGSTQYELV